MDKKRIAVTFLIVLTNAIGATAILPMLPIYVEDQFDATPIQATLVIAAFYAAQFVAAPWLGRLSDRYGRRRILILSQIGTIASYLMFIFAVPLGDSLGLTLGLSGGLIVVYLARLLDGVTGGNVSVAEAYASDISDEKSRAQTLGLIGGAVGLGHILGPALAVALSGISLVAPMVGAAVISGITLLLTIILLEETLTPEIRAKKETVVSRGSVFQELRDHSVTLVLMAAFATSLYIASLFSSFSLYAERVLFPDETSEIIARNVNLMIMVVGLAAAFSQIFLISPLVRWFGEQRLILIGSVLLLGSALGISTGSLTLVLISLFAYALGFGVSWTSLQTIVTRLGSPESVGNRLGLFQSAFSLAFIFAPLLVGILLELFDARAIFYGGAVLMGLASLLAILILHITLPGSELMQSGGEMQAESGALLHRLHH